MPLKFDHLVYGCAELDEGIEWFARKFGVRLPKGGEHLKMATHNAVAALKDDGYVELIAINPNAEPTMPRWFGLDTSEVQNRLAKSPQLLTWVANTDDIDSAIIHLYGKSHGMRQFEMERGNYRWRFADLQDGSLNEGGTKPNIIQWLSEPPVDTMTKIDLPLSNFIKTKEASDILLSMQSLIKLAKN